MDRNVADVICHQNELCKTILSGIEPAIGSAVLTAMTLLSDEFYFEELVEFNAMVIFTHERGVYSSYDEALKALENLRPPAPFLSGSPLSLLRNGGIGGAILGGLMHGVVNYMEYSDHDITGEKAIYNTITGASICGTATAVGAYVGAGLCAPTGPGMAVCSLVGGGAGWGVGWALEKAKDWTTGFIDGRQKQREINDKIIDGVHDGQFAVSDRTIDGKTPYDRMYEFCKDEYGNVAVQSPADSFSWSIKFMCLDLNT